MTQETIQEQVMARAMKDPTLAQPGYGDGAPPQPAHPGVYTPSIAAPPKRGGARLALMLVLVLVVLVGGGAAALLLVLRTGQPVSPVFDRHGLQSNVPLPDNLTFQYKRTDTSGGIIADEWIWTVKDRKPEAVNAFYRNHLPSNGWTRVQAVPNEDLGLLACQGTQMVVVYPTTRLEDTKNETPTTTTAPPGGSALGIALTSDKGLVAQYCATTLGPTA
jgi:hypothetical protein